MKKLILIGLTAISLSAEAATLLEKTVKSKRLNSENYLIETCTITDNNKLILKTDVEVSESAMSKTPNTSGFSKEVIDLFQQKLDLPYTLDPMDDIMLSINSKATPEERMKFDERNSFSLKLKNVATVTLPISIDKKGVSASIDAVVSYDSYSNNFIFNAQMPILLPAIAQDVVSASYSAFKGVSRVELFDYSENKLRYSKRKIFGGSLLILLDSVCQNGKSVTIY